MNLYASGRAIEAVKEWSAGSRFPIGTLLVKEKFETEDRLRSESHYP